MNLRGLTCACSPEETLPLDHHESGACRLEKVERRAPRAWFRKILEMIRDDDDHAGGRLTASRLTACAREVLISDFVPCAPDLMDFNAMAFGQAAHAWMGSDCERREGVIFGIPFSGRPDLIEAGCVDDYKMGNPGSHARKWGAGSVSLEYAIQVSAYLLLGFGEGAGGVWSGSMNARYEKAPSWFWRPIFPMTEEEIGNARPQGGGYTCRQIAQSIDEGRRRIEAGEDAREVVASVPLMGKTQRFGKGTKCDYCAVRRECEGIG